MISKFTSITIWKIIHSKVNGEDLTSPLYTPLLVTDVRIGRRRRRVQIQTRQKQQTRQYCVGAAQRKYSKGACDVSRRKNKVGHVKFVRGLAAVGQNTNKRRNRTYNNGRVVTSDSKLCGVLWIWPCGLNASPVAFHHRSCCYWYPVPVSPGRNARDCLMQRSTVSSLKF